MIPGGFKGLQFLHKLRIIDRMNISLEERDTAIADFVRQNPRKGIPNPFIAAALEKRRVLSKGYRSKGKDLIS